MHESLGPAPRHGRVLRVGRAADPPDAARTPGARRRAGRTRCGGRRQLRVPGVRRAIGDADASGPPPDRRNGGGAAAPRRGLRRGQPPRARHGSRRRARSRAAVLRRGVRRARRTRRRHRGGRRGVLRGAEGGYPRCDRARRVRRGRIGQADRQDRLRAGQTRRHPGGPPRRGTDAVGRPAGTPTVGDRSGRRGEAAPAGHRHHRRLRRAVGRRSGQHPGRRPSGLRCTSWPAGSTTGPSPRADPPNRSARSPRFPRTSPHWTSCARQRARSGSTRMPASRRTAVVRAPSPSS